MAMLKRILLALVVMLALQPPAAAQADDVNLLRTMRALGDATSGQRVNGGQIADKVVYLGRRGATYVVSSIAALVPGGEGVEPPAGTVAVLRSRSATPGGNAAPAPGDVALALRTGLPIFIIGEWRTPPVIWEVVRQGTAVRYRELDPQGVAGPWRAPAG
jgi:hypothetical protein